MNLDVRGMRLYEGLLLILGSAPGPGVWASLGRLEAELCRIFASAYPSRTIKHFSSNNLAALASAGEDPGAYLLNLDLDIASQVIEYAARQRAFCLVGLHAAGGNVPETLLTTLPEDIACFEVCSVAECSEPLRLLSGGSPIRLFLSAANESLGQPGDLLGVSL